MAQSVEMVIALWSRRGAGALSIYQLTFRIGPGVGPRSQLLDHI